MIETPGQAEIPQTYKRRKGMDLLDGRLLALIAFIAVATALGTVNLFLVRGTLNDIYDVLEERLPRK